MYVKSQSTLVRVQDAACSIKIRAQLQKKTNQSSLCFGCGRLATALHGNAAAINMPSSSPSDSGDLTAANGGFISPACGYKCELMQVAAIKLVNDFASGGSLETNVLQFNATARVHSEYQVICEGGVMCCETIPPHRK